MLSLKMKREYPLGNYRSANIYPA